VLPLLAITVTPNNGKGSNASQDKTPIINDKLPLLETDEL
jgi:hypothetical protein